MTNTLGVEWAEYGIRTVQPRGSVGFGRAVAPEAAAPSMVAELV